MSNFLAIATVTAALRRALLEVVQIDVSGADVTTVRPDRPGAGGTPTRGVNIFLYQVSVNPALRNNDLPTRDSSGRLRHAPQLALNLDYLFSFYGSDGLQEPQRLLGSTLRYLHSRPQLTRAMIESAVADTSISFLARSDLSQALESVRLSPIALSLDDLSRVWSIFFQVPYFLSAAYRASVVVIEPSFSPAPALPVRGYDIQVVPFARAVIDSVGPADPTASGLEADGVLVVRGSGLAGAGTQVVVGDASVAAAAGDLLPSGAVRVEVLRFDAATLRAGVKTVKLARLVDVGHPPAPHRALDSNLGVFLLQPLPGIARVLSPELHLQVSPPTGVRQQVRLLLDAPDGRSYSLDPVDGPATEPQNVSAGAAASDPAITELALAAAAPLEIALADPRPAFSGLSRNPATVNVTSNDSVVRTLSLAGPFAALSAAGAALQTALRSAAAIPAYASAQVIVDRGQLIVIPRGSGNWLRFGRNVDDPACDELGLRTAAVGGALLTSDLSTFAGVTNNPAAVTITIGTEKPLAVSIVGAPVTLAAAAAALETGLQIGSTNRLFTEARVRVVGSRLLIAHGRTELRFPLTLVPSGSYLLRIEVDGVASALRTDAAGRYTDPSVTVP